MIMLSAAPAAPVLLTRSMHVSCVDDGCPLAPVHAGTAAEGAGPPSSGSCQIWRVVELLPPVLLGWIVTVIVIHEPDATDGAWSVRGRATVPASAASRSIVTFF